MAVFFFIAYKKCFKFHAQPQTGAYSCFAVRMIPETTVNAIWLNFQNSHDRLNNPPFLIASFSSLFQCSATSLARGSSGLGLLSRAWMLSRTVLICSAGLHFSVVRCYHTKNDNSSLEHVGLYHSVPNVRHHLKS